MNVKTLLLVGGVEVLAECEVRHGAKGEVSYFLSRPMQVIHAPVPMQTPQGVALQVMAQMVPLWSTAIQTTILVSADQVIGAPMEPTKQAEQGYLQQTTGIRLQ